MGTGGQWRVWLPGQIDALHATRASLLIMGETWPWVPPSKASAMCQYLENRLENEAS